MICPAHWYSSDGSGVTGKKCEHPAVKDGKEHDDLCWVHASVVRMERASREEVLAGKRRPENAHHGWVK